MVPEATAHAREHDTFWLKSHPYPMTLMSRVCANYPSITFARPKGSNEKVRPRGSLANKSPKLWMR
jgi:hypothetical protein